MSPDQSVFVHSIIWRLLPPSGCTVLWSSVLLSVFYYFLSLCIFLVSSGLLSSWPSLLLLATLCLLNLRTISLIPSLLLFVFSSFPRHLVRFIIVSSSLSRHLSGLKWPLWCWQLGMATVKSSTCWCPTGQKSMPRTAMDTRWAAIFVS